MAQNVQKLLNSTLAGKMARQLDAKDGTDNKISASIWNDFVARIGTGKTINDSISVVQAMNSITTYCCKLGAADGKSGTQKAQEWCNEHTDLFIQSEPAVEKQQEVNNNGNIPSDNKSNPSEEEPPLPDGVTEPPRTMTEILPQGVQLPKVTMPPQMTNKSVLRSYEQFRDENHAGQVIELGGRKYKLDDLGRIESEFGTNNKEIRSINYKDSENGSTKVYGIVDYRYDKDGENNTRRIWYKADGSLVDFKDIEYENGEITRAILYDADGSIRSFYDREYKDGKVTREIDYNKDGSVKEFWDVEYYDDGGKRYIQRNSNGDLMSFFWYQDKDGGTVLNVKYENGKRKTVETE